MNIIINLHEVSDPYWLDKAISFLKSKFTFISLEELIDFYQGKREIQECCHLTVDDAHISFYNNIFPVLKEQQVPASLFASPKVCEEKVNFWFQEISGYNELLLKQSAAEVLGISIIDLGGFSIECILKTQPLANIWKIIDLYQKRTNTIPKKFVNMSVDQLREVDQSGLVAVGAHTLNHPILMNETDITSEHEIKGSVDRLSSILHRPVTHFAYPNGIPGFDFCERQEKSLQDAGVKIAFTTEARTIRKDDNRYRIPRFGVSDLESNFLLRAKLFFGSGWSGVQRFKSRGEYQQRNKLTLLQK